MTAIQLDFGFSIASAVFAVLSGVFWVCSARAETKAPPGSAPGSGWGGYMVGLNARGEPVDLVSSLHSQWRWNSRAAWSAALAALFQGADLVVRHLL